MMRRAVAPGGGRQETSQYDRFLELMVLLSLVTTAQRPETKLIFRMYKGAIIPI
jgi:hypothetical protein